MRQVVLDTETTGMSAANGHRIIEIGAVEIVNRRLTDNVFHRYLNPEREIDAGATNVHGIRSEDLVDEPKFVEIVEDFLAFVNGSELIIHNADFDVGFINAELALCSAASDNIGSMCQVLDTLALAREMHPGLRNNLDALCRRYDVDNSNRELHGALLDANLLARVYLAMTGGQASLSLADSDAITSSGHQAHAEAADNLRQFTVVRIEVSDTDRSQHEQLLDKIAAASGKPALWREAP